MFKKRFYLVISFFIFCLFFLIKPVKVFGQCTPCSNDYYADCTKNGQPGTQFCHKRGCVTAVTPDNPSGCTWGNGSYCEPCRSANIPTPTQPPSNPCEVRSGGQYGYCTKEGGVGYGTHCNPICNSDWSYPETWPNVECYTLQCTCTNARRCCRPITPPTGPPPPTQPPPPPPPPPPPTVTPGGPPTVTPGGPTNTPSPTGPTVTPGGPTNTPTPTWPPGVPTNTPTLTPIPGTPTPTYIPVALPTYRAGQTNPLNISKPAQTWRCLKSQYYVGPIRPNGQSNHRLRLTGDNFPTAPIPIHIASCVATGNGTKCTTGNNNLDQSLELSKDPTHTFYVQPDNPMTVNNYNGSLDKVVYSHSASTTVHTFYAILLNEPVIDERTGGTIQYKSFKFKEDITKCTAVRWDPYGRVFDSQSLEPIPNVKITILDVNKKPVSLPGLINPDITTVNGAFNFLVEAGSYYLLPQPAKEYLFTNNSKLDPGYIKAYSNIYRPNDLIIEKEGLPEHRDIPLDPGDNPPFISSPSSVNFAVLPIQGANQTKIVGQVSHPLTIVSLQQNNKEIAKTWADKMGFYELLIDNKNITQGIKIVPRFTKVNLTENRSDAKPGQTIFSKIFDYVQSFFKKKTSASPIAFGTPIDPIPRYLEGYIAPLAFVNVKTVMSDRNYWQTKTDEKGFLIVLPQNLPLFDFYLEVIPQNAPSFTLPISEFILKNKQYLNINNVNLMTATKNGVPIE